jgi:hypothetical protein
MAQDLTVNIKTTSDVPQAMDKAKTATVGLSKQVEDIQKKFSTSFKDIFLSVLGPMALFGTAIALIGRIIADNQRKQEEANQAAIDGTNRLMSAEDRYYANKRNNEKKEKETVEQAKTAREQTTREFLLSRDPRAAEIYAEELRLRPIGETDRTISMSRRKEIQDKVQALIAEDMKKNPELGVKVTSENKETTFKGPEGFSNVIGVGPNPVIEAMARQIEIQEQQLAELKKISGTDNAVPTDFTKTPSK